ncbi:MAG TPA: outer membrane beta-barrel protein [Gemmatimonadota bacterium]|nr:outer membrane beta-barrel protein [Gemmatimonadota bacterium]
MKNRRWIVAIAVIATLAGAKSAHAQGRYIRPWELNVHAGAFFPDQLQNDDTELMLGARILVNLLSGWSFGGSFDWVPRNEIRFGNQDIDINTYLYSGGVEYNFSSQSTTRFFAGAGLGAATTKLSDVPENAEDSETDFLVPLALGIKWFDRPADPSWGIRAELRDNIIWWGRDDDPTNNFEISGGVSFLFGE